MMKVTICLLLAVSILQGSIAFTPSSWKTRSIHVDQHQSQTPQTMTMRSPLYSTSDKIADSPKDPGAVQTEVKRMVDDDEWDGVTMSLTEAVVSSVLETVSSKTKSFIGKDDYSVGDITKQVDLRIKQAVANMRGKENYEIGDLIAYATEQSIAVAEQTTGKKLDSVTELSKSIDSKVKGAVNSYTGKDTYKPGDLTKAVSSTVTTRVKGFATVCGVYVCGQCFTHMFLYRHTNWIKWPMRLSKRAKSGHESIWAKNSPNTSLGRNWPIVSQAKKATSLEMFRKKSWQKRKNIWMACSKLPRRNHLLSRPILSCHRTRMIRHPNRHFVALRSLIDALEVKRSH